MSAKGENQRGHPAYGKQRPRYREHAPGANHHVLCEEARVRTGLRELFGRRTIVQRLHWPGHSKEELWSLVGVLLD